MNNYSFIDMHIHTVYSDEELCDETPEHILQKAQSYAEKFNKENGTNKKCLISFTDHNTTLACIKAKELLKTGRFPNVEVISGCEFTTDLCELEGITNNIKLFIKSHFLAYNFDEKNQELLAYSMLTHLHFSINDNTGEQLCATRREICEKYGIYIPFSTFSNLTKLGKSANFRQEFLNDVVSYLDAKKIVYNKLDLQTIIENNISSSVSYNQNVAGKCRLKLSEVVKLVKDAGGDVVLAHPALLKVKQKKLSAFLPTSSATRKELNGAINTLSNIYEHQDVLEIFIKAYQKLTGKKLDGIELYHHTSFKHNLDVSVINLCKKYGMYVTCGSDYHGVNFVARATLGNGLPYELQEAYRELTDRPDIKQLLVRIGSISAIEHFKEGKNGYSDAVFINDKNEVLHHDVIKLLFSNASIKRKYNSILLKTNGSDSMHTAIVSAINQLQKYNGMLSTIVNGLDNPKRVIKQLKSVDKFSFNIIQNVKFVVELCKNANKYNLSFKYYDQIVSETKHAHKMFTQIIEEYPNIIDMIGRLNHRDNGNFNTTFDKIATITIVENEPTK